MHRQLFSILALLVVASSPVEAGCVDPATLVHSTAGIARYFDEKERQERSGALGVSGTGWFLSPTSMVTIEHVATFMNLSDQNWKPIEIRNAEGKLWIPTRIQRLVGSSAEKITVLELQTAFPGAQGIQLRMERLVPEEPLVSLAYPDNQLRFAGGRFVQYGDGDKFAGTALLEMFDGNDRLVLDHGSSGAPVLDCEGRAVAVVSNLFTSTLQFMSRSLRVSSAWGSPNVVSVPVQLLNGLSHVE